jgi:hypothetical protein
VDLELDGLRRAHLRRMMGFDFRIKIRPNKIHISSKEEPYVTTSCKLKEDETNEYGHILKEEAIDRLVAACLRLKTKFEEAKK